MALALGIPLALAALPSVSAQDPIAVTLQAEPESLTLEAGNATTVNVTVANGGSLDGEASLSLAAVPDGWSAQLDPETMNVPAGGTRTAELALRAAEASPGERTPDGGQTQGQVTARATLVDASGQFSDADEVSIATTRIVPSSPPPDPAGTPWAWLLGGAGALAMIGALAGVAWLRRSPPQPFEVTEPGIVRPRNGGHQVGLDVKNTDGEDHVATLSLERIAEGWHGGFNRDEFPLEPQQTQRVWLALQPFDVDDPSRPAATLAVVRAEAKGVQGSASQALVTLKRDPDEG